jgi:hypothetical protein
MRPKLLIVTLGLALGSAIIRADQELSPVQPGDSYEDVIAALGQPEGFIKMEPSVWLKYDRGTVKIHNNRVVQAELISQEEADALRALRLAEEKQRRIYLAELKDLRLSEGTAIKRERIADPYFLSLPASRQVAFWEQFRILYPEISSDMEYADAISRYEIEQKQTQVLQQQETRIRDLENRLQQAEWERDRTVRVSFVQPYYYYPTTICRPVVKKSVTIQKTTCRTTTPLMSANYSDLARYPGFSMAAKLGY